MTSPLSRLSASTLASIMGCTERTAEGWVDALITAMLVYRIDTVQRVAAFLAQIGHESGGLQFVSEIWGPTNAQKRYEGRVDLGNTEQGDGYRYRGRGLIQITGRYNYGELSKSLGVDFVADPDLVSSQKYAAISAAWYWDKHNLNGYADVGDFDRITRRINGGTNGADDRNRRYATALMKLESLMSEDGAAPSAEEQAPAPVEELPAIPAQTTEGNTMAPFIAAAIPSLIQAAPDLVRVFGGKNAEKNAAAAEVVAKIAMESTSQPTIEGAVRSIEQNPSQADAFREAVRYSFAELLQLAELDEKSRDAAMGRNAQLMATDPRWIYVIGGIAFFVVLSSYVLAGLVITGDFSPEVKAMVITGVVIASIGTVLAFLFGSSHGSRIKDERK